MKVVGVGFLPPCHKTTIVRSMAMKATDIRGVIIDLPIILFDRPVLLPFAFFFFIMIAFVSTFSNAE